MGTDASKVVFVREVRRALSGLYDPGTLTSSPLVRLLNLEPRADATLTLRRFLIDGIDGLEPDVTVPPGSIAWRIYRILYYRFVEQFTQEQVARDLALSSRQLRRQEKAAVQVLADRLWASLDLEHAGQSLGALTQAEVAPADMAASGYNQELEWLEKMPVSASADICQMVQAVLQTARPMIDTLRVSVACDVSNGLPPLALQPIAVKQALLQIIVVAARSVPGGRLRVEGQALPRQPYAQIRVVAESSHTTSPGTPDVESLDMARRLVEISGGTLEVRAGMADATSIVAVITLATAGQIPVLVIDDNADTLQLLERYLSGSRYRFFGTSSPTEALELANRIKPGAIVLDIMLPEIDGWDLLGRLREHPQTRGVPVIVCTILPQEQLATMLGAAEFIGKPASRKALLSALDRQLGPGARESE